MFEARRGGLGERSQRGCTEHYAKICKNGKAPGYDLWSLHVQRRLYLPDNPTIVSGKNHHRSEYHAKTFRLSGLLLFLRRTSQPRLRNAFYNPVSNGIHYSFSRDRCMRPHSDIRGACLWPVKNSYRFDEESRSETVARRT